MKLYLVLLTVFLIFQYNAHCQVYTGNWDDRTLAMQVNQKAVDKLEANDIDVAFQYLSEAISIDSIFLSPYQNLYKVLLEDGTYADTIIYYLEMGTRIFEEDDQLCFALGEAYRLADDLEKAILAYTEAINYSKKWGEDFYLVHYYHFNRGNCYLKQGYIEPALNDYNYTLKLKPDFSPVFINRGICYFKLQDKEAACKDWDKAIEMGAKQARKYLEKHCK